eukprot:CAMPEP_0206467744 /NCGR_PEP_ID=MMETSP0324_2-20121206/29213_2 /ASSEMBLY_ACC=CAM_ASM_000836 /TAXON_ID=2866 /ORGANISM="Crypthecodinium cohnii, Strain Seligo" /LENGTH=66 /DNA_ID=CAMNT_0053941063 /DNA_START=235 /DNA_END=435 /DNA_ORIENTATION=-
MSAAEKVACDPGGALATCKQGLVVASEGAVEGECEFEGSLGRLEDVVGGAKAKGAAPTEDAEAESG